MQRVAAHPQLQGARDLQTFLEASDDTLESWKESTKQKAPAFTSMAADVKQGAYSSASRISSYFAGEGPSATFEPVADMPLMQMANYTSALQTQVQAVHKHSKSYMERHGALSFNSWPSSCQHADASRRSGGSGAAESSAAR